jgi:excinuclease ABC subunit C
MLEKWSMEKSNLKEFSRALPNKPGVYQMKNLSGKIIYVGKAKNLKNRVSSYWSANQDSAKTIAMVKNIAAIDYIVTNSESEALLLESNLIKEYKPRYNITFRDDKSYPYLYLSTADTYPKLSFYRGARKKNGRYFGPYPSAGASRKTLNIVQKLFKLRQCDDSFFNNRNRPCLQYQINRCSAPCVGLINQPDYTDDIAMAVLFMEGKNERILNLLTEQMISTSKKLEYEKAAKIRDQIAMLRAFQESQHIISDKGEADYIACDVNSGQACVQVFIIRGGRNLGNKTYYPSIKLQQGPAEIITAFINQYYLDQEKYFEIPDNIYTSHKLKDIDLFEKVLKRSGRAKKIKFNDNPRGERAKILKLAKHNAELTLKQKLSKNLKFEQQFESLGKVLERDETISRIECFDISHHSGKVTIGSCVVFGRDGTIKSDYRKFNVHGVPPGDDYQAMEQVIKRHYSKLQKQEKTLPDIILIDGGKGQLSRAAKIVNELQLGNAMQLLGIAKGPGRKPGLEKLYVMSEDSLIKLQVNPPVLLLLQEIRDEAHRFAISGHRNKSRKELTKSPLDNIEGIGNKRKQCLILHFGGIQGIISASVDEIVKVPGISKNLAERIYTSLH